MVGERQDPSSTCFPAASAWPRTLPRLTLSTCFDTTTRLSASKEAAQHFAQQAKLLAEHKLERLRTLQLFVLDNTVRESTVAQLRGHTLPDKHRLIRLVRDVGIRHQLVGCFAHQRRVDDQLARLLQSDESLKAEYATQTFYGFAEFHEIHPNAPGEINEAPTIGLLRAQEYGIANIVMEIDCCCKVVGDSPEHVPRVTALLAKRLEWIRNNLGPASRVFINLRDYITAVENPSTQDGVVRWLSSLPPAERIAGLLFEDPVGGVFPATLGGYVADTRAIMDEAGWMDGELLVHIHQGYGLAEACVLESLACGATGIWCGIAREGAAVGHANSLTTICNLQRLGNEDARQRFDLAKLRAAAIEATIICTGEPPYPQMELYGSRSCDVCFAFGMGAGPNDFDPVHAMAVQPHIRVSTMTSIPMFGDKLSQVFGAEAAPDGKGGWDHEVLRQMWANVNRDLLDGVKEEYDDAAALLELYEHSGGTVGDVMRAKVDALTSASTHHVVTAFRHRFTAAFGEEAHECTAREFYAQMCARYFANPDSPQFKVFCQLCAFHSDEHAAELHGSAHDQDTVHLAAAASRFAWAAECYPHECSDLDSAWMCIVNHLVLRRLAQQTVHRRFRVSVHKLQAANMMLHDAHNRLSSTRLESAPAA